MERAQPINKTVTCKFSIFMAILNRLETLLTSNGAEALISESEFLRELKPVYFLSRTFCQDCDIHPLHSPNIKFVNCVDLFKNNRKTISRFIALVSSWTPQVFAMTHNLRRSSLLQVQLSLLKCSPSSLWYSDLLEIFSPCVWSQPTHQWRGPHAFCSSY